MRYIPLSTLVKQVFANASGKKDKKRLLKAHIKLVSMTPGDRQDYIRDNGPTKWAPIKNRMTTILGNKCWYTEVELLGAPLTIDHYRPVCDYWWLAFDSENYRVSCPYANSPEHNTLHGCAGGKGSSFPLLGRGMRATGKTKLRREKPVILDPCKKEDCDLVAFQVDGRPIVNPHFATDVVAVKRVDESKILLNLDHPDFNSKREQLYHDIANDVRMYEDLPDGAASRMTISNGLKARLAASAPFSTAARYYLQLHRHLDWVEALLK